MATSSLNEWIEQATYSFVNNLLNPFFIHTTYKRTISIYYINILTTVCQYVKPIVKITLESTMVRTTVLSNEKKLPVW